MGAGIQQAYNTGAARGLDTRAGVGVRGTLGRSPVEQWREVRAPCARGAGKGRAADAPGRRVTAPQLPGNRAGRQAGGRARGVGVGAGTAGLQRGLKRAAPSSGLRAKGRCQDRQQVRGFTSPLAQFPQDEAEDPHWQGGQSVPGGPPPWTGEEKNHTGSGIGFKKDLFN